MANPPAVKPGRFSVRPYRPEDRGAVRFIFAQDEFARPRLLCRYPRMGEYLADESSIYYADFEPESLIVAEAGGSVVGALLGAVDTLKHKRLYKSFMQPLLIRRLLSGAYGVPFWYLAVMRTALASRSVAAPPVDLRAYPAHLHIGVLPAWRRQGIGSALMAGYAAYLRKRDVAGYHLYASSFHPLGVAFYQKIGLEELGQFTWRLHDGFGWSTVIEKIFARRLD